MAPPLAKAERVYPADAGSDRRDRPGRTLALPACRTSVEGIVFARIRVNMVLRALSTTFANGLAPMRIWIRIQNGSFGLHPKGDGAKDENPKVSNTAMALATVVMVAFLAQRRHKPNRPAAMRRTKAKFMDYSAREHGRR